MVFCIIGFLSISPTQSPYNDVSLQVIGDDSAPTYFTLGDDRIIRVRDTADLNAHDVDAYRVRSNFEKG